MPSVHGPLIGAQVKRLRIERGWTQEELARYSEVSRPTIARLETGAGITTLTLSKLCEALNAKPVLQEHAS